MKIYRNPWVSRTCYFIKTGKASSFKNELSKSKGYIVERDVQSGGFKVEQGTFYDCDLKEMPLVAETKTSIQRIIDEAIITAVLEATDNGTK